MSGKPPGPLVAVVDDDLGILRSLEQLLESADYSARLFVSATALLQSDALLEVECVISDVDMPGIDGFELVRLAKATRPDLPVILITGYPDRLKRPPRFDGAQPRYFTKPFQGADLLAAVRDALRDVPG